MYGYDWDFGFGFGRRYSAHGRGGYDRSYGRGHDRGFGSAGYGRGGGSGSSGYGRRPFGGPARTWQAPGGGAGRGGYDRGLYGGEHPTFGGYPGGRRQGMYYGGPGSGWGGRGPQGERGFTGGYDRGWGGGRGGYDAGFAREPFLPDAAYRRHPELDRPQRHGGRWPAQGHEPDHDTPRSDDEIERAVRENLYQDSWVEGDAIEVSVEDGVVTLTGEVSDYLQARYAWDDAWEASGVRGVINQITVRTDLPADEHSTAQPQTGTKS